MRKGLTTGSLLSILALGAAGAFGPSLTTTSNPFKGRVGQKRHRKGKAGRSFKSKAHDFSGRRFNPAD